MANQPLAEITKVVRVKWTILGVVALAISLPLILAFGVLPFAPIPDIAKYVAGGFLALFALMVWLQFWAKAKRELFAAGRIESLPAGFRFREISQTPKPGDKNGSQP